MPRQARLDAPGVLHHIMIRGIERRNIFTNDRDQEDMLDRLAKLLPRFKPPGGGLVRSAGVMTWIE